MENKKFIEKLKKGEQKAFKQAYLMYYPKLILAAKKFNFKFLSPDDFAQETFLKLYQNKHLLKTEVLFDKQLYSICKNNIINHLKREQKVIPLNNYNTTLEKDEDTNTQTLLEHRKQELLKLIKQLPEQQQKIYVLHKLEQYTYQEIIELTGLSKKTIANHIYLANKFLQKKTGKA